MSVDKTNTSITSKV